MSPARLLITVWRAVLGLVALASAIACYVQQRHGVDATRYLSYFTTLSTVTGSAALLAGSIPAWHGRLWLDRLRGAAALYAVVTGVVYLLLLGGHAPTWTGWVQHRILPVALPLDWLLVAPVHRLPCLRTLFSWLAVPIVYLGYILVHGAQTGWYPYPFLNASRQGYTDVSAYALGIAGLFVAFASILLTLADLRQRPPRQLQSTRQELTLARENA